MRLFLIRHGETVDNVKGVYAGTLDSALTNHGTEQANRLGESFAENSVAFSHIFASPLSRAFKTAQAIQKAQTNTNLEIVKAQELVERDYGAYEGRPYASKAQWMSTGSDGTEEARGGVESAISMAKRCDTFLDLYLLPLFDEDSRDAFVIAVVAHGMLLSHLWRRLLLRMPKDSLIIAPEIIAARGNIIPDRLGGWSNTGYLELSIRREDEPQAKPTSSVDQSQGATEDGEVKPSPTPVPPPLQSEGADLSVTSPKRQEKAIGSNTSPSMLTGRTTTIVAIDSRKHLLGLKRQPGGIGSLANDQSQKKVDTFFKPLKLS